jgi:hypothetical protein
VGEVDLTVAVFYFFPKKIHTNLYHFGCLHAYNIYPQSLYDLKPLFFWLTAPVEKSILIRSVICEDNRIEIYDVTIFPYMQNR